MNKETNKLTPELRFPEFVNKEQWISEPLDKTYRFLVTNSLSRENLNYQSGLVKNIHYGDIHTKFSTLFDILKEKVPYINPEVSIDRISQDNYCQEGDMVFADASEDIQDVGKSIEITNLNNEKLLSGLHTLLARQIEQKLIIGFGGYLFKSESIRKQIQKEAQGTKVLSISATRISKINIYYPESTIEQQKIADCLSSLDELITVHTDKLETLKTYKKGLMQNLFPKEGEKVPKLRFKEFEKDGKWVEKKLSKLAKKVLNKNSNGIIKTVFTNSAVSGIVNQRDYFDRDIANKSNLENYYVVEDGDYVYNPRISEYAPVGPISKNKMNKTGVMSPLYTVFRFDEDKNDFYEYYFQSSHWYFSIKKTSNAGARFDRMNITASDFMNILVLFTSPKEQKKIAETLYSLDNLIKEQVNKIEQLKLHKKGLMQGLFPKTNQ